MWTNFENQSTCGEVMDNIIVDCFLTHSVCSARTAE